MDRFLQAYDLKLHVCAELSGDKKSLYALARTCHAFLEPSLVHLWRTIHSFEPLLACLPAGSWREERQRSMFTGKKFMVYPGREFTAEDLKRYRECYASRIRVFHLKSTTNMRVLSKETLESLRAATGREDGALAPNLKHFGWEPDLQPIEGVPGWSRKVHSQLHWAFPLFVRDSVSSLLSVLAKGADLLSVQETAERLRKLQYITLWAEYGSVFQECLTPSGCWANLKSVSLEGCLAFSIPHLASLPRMTDLRLTSIREIPDLIEEAEAVASNPSSFKSLTRLSVGGHPIDDAAQFLHFLPPSNKVRVVQCFGTQEAYEEACFFAIAVIEHRLNPLTLETLEIRDMEDPALCDIGTRGIGSQEEEDARGLNYAPDYMDLERTGGHPSETGVNIGPLFKFTKLKKLILNVTPRLVVTKTEVDMIVKTWPNIEHLDLCGPLPLERLPSIDYSHLLQIVETCKTLRVLGLPFDGTRLLDTEESPIKSDSVEVLRVCGSPIQGTPASVAAIIRRDFPRLKDMNPAYSRWLTVNGPSDNLWTAVEDVWRNSADPDSRGACELETFERYRRYLTHLILSPLAEITPKRVAFTPATVLSQYHHHSGSLRHATPLVPAPALFCTGLICPGDDMPTASAPDGLLLLETQDFKLALAAGTNALNTMLRFPGSFVCLSASLFTSHSESPQLTLPPFPAHCIAIPSPTITKSEFWTGESSKSDGLESDAADEIDKTEEADIPGQGAVLDSLLYCASLLAIHLRKPPSSKMNPGSHPTSHTITVDRNWSMGVFCGLRSTAHSLRGSAFDAVHLIAVQQPPLTSQTSGINDAWSSSLDVVDSCPLSGLTAQMGADGCSQLIADACTTLSPPTASLAKPVTKTRPQDVESFISHSTRRRLPSSIQGSGSPDDSKASTRTPTATASPAAGCGEQRIGGWEVEMAEAGGLRAPLQPSVRRPAGDERDRQMTTGMPVYNACAQHLHQGQIFNTTNLGPGPVNNVGHIENAHFQLNDDRALLWDCLPRQRDTSGRRNEYLEGSRERDVQAILQWIDDAPRDELVLWVHGAAGLGKSTFARHLTHLLREDNRLAASVILSGVPSDARGPESVVKIMAREIGTTHPTVIPIVLSAISSCNGAPMRKQVMKYLRDPIRSLQRSHPLVFILDAIDEWESHDLLVKELASLAGCSFMLKFILLGRSSPRMRGFQDRWIRPYPLGPVSSATMERYFSKELACVTWDNGRPPNRNEVMRLVALTNGLFIWAMVVCSLMKRRLSRSSPREALEAIIYSRRSIGAEGGLANLYRQAIFWLFPNSDELDLFRQYLGAALVLQEALPVDAFSSLTKLPSHVVLSIRSELMALQIRQPENRSKLIHPAGTIFHLSFLEYLQSSSAQRDLAFQISPLGSHSQIAESCLLELLDFLPNAQRPSPSDLPAHQRYSVKHMPIHVHRGTPPAEPGMYANWKQMRHSALMWQIPAEILAQWAHLFVPLLKPDSVLKEAEYNSHDRAQVMQDVADTLTEDGAVSPYQIACLEVAVHLQSENLATWRALGGAYRRVANLTRSQEECDQAVRAYNAALKVGMASDPANLGDLYYGMASTLNIRYRLIENTSDLAESISFHRKALALRPLGHPSRWSSLCDLGLSLIRTRAVTDLQEAILLIQEALELCAPENPNRWRSLIYLAISLQERGASRRCSGISPLVPRGAQALPAGASDRWVLARRRRRRFRLYVVVSCRIKSGCLQKGVLEVLEGKVSTKRPLLAKDECLPISKFGSQT
ncbi:hypothetical protein NMY22_g17341 [Coprinellus aureogranulatus]|nr:hypothetical protein NMY22_g17341 [Coprinellus aureogranulatus]